MDRAEPCDWCKLGAHERCDEDHDTIHKMDPHWDGTGACVCSDGGHQPVPWSRMPAAR